MRLFSILPFVAFAASAVIDLQQNEDYYNPTLAVDHSSKNPCAGQSHGSCTYNAKGNSHVYLGHKTNWGTVNPKDLIPKLKHACDSAGHCKPVSASGTFASKKTGIGKSGTLSLHVQDGIYADGQKSDLVDVVHRVVDNRIEHIERCAEQCPAPPYCEYSWLGELKHKTSDQTVWFVMSEKLIHTFPRYLRWADL